MDAVLYIHGKGGSADEAKHYIDLFPSCRVFGADYKSDLPWEAGREIKEEINKIKCGYGNLILIANSIGAFFSMNADIGGDICHAYFISPIVDMEKLITDMMTWAKVSEEELFEKGVIPTSFGEDLSWDYLTYVREHPLKWDVPTDILYGGKDKLTSFETVSDFADKHGASLTVMENGEHWFHTDEQMKFLDNWIQKRTMLWKI